MEKNAQDAGNILKLLRIITKSYAKDVKAYKVESETSKLKQNILIFFIISINFILDRISKLLIIDFFSSGQSEYGFTKPYSEVTAQTIDKEISNLIEGQYQRAITILKENKDKLTKLAERLLEKEVIFKDDLEEIFGKRPFEKETQSEVSQEGTEVTPENKEEGLDA